MFRTTISCSDTLAHRVDEHLKETGETQTDFFNRAILNQLEKDGDFEVRDLVEEEIENGKDKQTI